MPLCYHDRNEKTVYNRSNERIDREDSVWSVKMKNALVIVGMSLGRNRSFVSYLKRSVEAEIGFIESLHILDKRDSDLFLLLEEIVEKHPRVIIATHEGFALVGKILSTLSEDTLVLTEGMLIPSKARNYTERSYLLRYKKHQINVLDVRTDRKIPPLLVEKEHFVGRFFLFEEEGECLWDLLKAEAEVYELNLIRSPLIEGVYRIEATGFIEGQMEGFLTVLQTNYREKVLIGEDLGEIATRKLMQQQKRITCAESCTGGLLASEIVRHAGVSSIFDGAVVSYANEVKRSFLGVKKQTLESRGAVSEETVTQMLRGVLKKFDADYAMAISGIAGPEGGTPQKPVGTVYIGARSREEKGIVKRVQLYGDRRYIQEQAVWWAFKLLLFCDKKLFF